MSDVTAPIHPGEILLEDFMKPAGVSINGLAKELHIGASRVSEIVRGRRGVTADTALRLSRHLGTTAEFWMNLQAAYDLWMARRWAA
jgi:addiction module HigA family antidote